MQYTTQMDAARKGMITAQMEAVSQKEGIPAAGRADGGGKGHHSLQQKA